MQIRAVRQRQSNFSLLFAYCALRQSANRTMEMENSIELFLEGDLELREHMLGELECPSCLDHVTGPIRNCKEGHLVLIT